MAGYKREALVQVMRNTARHLPQSAQLLSLSERLPLDEAADAVQRLADGATVGRVVVVP